METTDNIGKGETEKPYTPNVIGLTSNKVFSILAYRAIGPAVGTLETVYATRDPEAFGQVLAILKDARRGKPKLREATLGNRRSVGVVRIENPGIAAVDVRSGKLPSIPEAGTVWDSVKAASVALGLSARSLQEYFRRAKRVAGAEAPVIVRGVCVMYTDSPGWDEQRPKAKNRPDGLKFEDFGGRKSSSEARADVRRFERNINT